MSDCIFCKIASGEIPAKKVYEDENLLAYYDIAPKSKGHTLVIPKKHAANLLEIGPEDLSILIAGVKKVAGILKAELNCDGFNILQNNGEAAGQSVHHIHFHIIPRYNGEKLEFAL